MPAQNSRHFKNQYSPTNISLPSINIFNNTGNALFPLGVSHKILPHYNLKVSQAGFRAVGNVLCRTRRNSTGCLYESIYTVFQNSAESYSIAARPNVETRLGTSKFERRSERNKVYTSQKMITQ